MASAVTVFLVTCLMTLVKTRYILRANFVTYNNSLHAYWNGVTGNGSCCDGNDFPTNCSDPCNTHLTYCFKNYGTQNDISDDGNIISDCLGIGRPSRLLQEPTDYIDYSMPPLTVFNTTSPTSLTLSPGEPWPGQMQFFVRSAVGENVIDYFVLDFILSVGDTIDYHTINGTSFGSDVTFTVSLCLRCGADFYGPNCSIYCSPANSSERGHYTCLSNGRKQCLPGYQDLTTNCMTCVPAEGCHPEHGFCNTPGECHCHPGYGENLCHQDLDVCGHTSPCHTSELCTSTGPDSYDCTTNEATTNETTTNEANTKEDDSSSSSVVVGVSVGGLLLLTTLLTIAVLVAVVAVRRRAVFQHVHIGGGGSKGRSSDLHSDSEIGLATNPAYAVHRHGTQPTPGPACSTSISATGHEGYYKMDNNPVYTIGIPSNEEHPRSDTIPVPEYDYPFVPPAETL